MQFSAKRAAAYGGSVLLIAAVYYATAMLGLRFDAVSGFATLVWPPTGIALAALLLFGIRYWPGVALGAFAANFTADAPVLVALGVAAGNTAEACLGAYLLKRAKFDPSMERVHDVTSFVVRAALLSTLVSATVGVASLRLGGIIGTSAIARTWTAWWVGDVLGALVVGALLIVAFNALKTGARIEKLREALALAVTVMAVAAAVFVDPFEQWVGHPPVIYAVLLPLLWASLRFGLVGTTVAMFAVSVVAVWGTVTGNGPFATGPLSDRLTQLQIFIGVVATAKLIVASVSMERIRAEQGLRLTGKDLEKKVIERTSQLAKANDELGRSKDALEKRRAVLQAVLNGLGEGVVAVDVTGNPLVINAATKKMIGMDPNDVETPLEKLVEQFPTYYVDGKTKVPLEDLPITQALRGETIRNERFVLKPAARPKGVPISATASPIRDDRGTIIGSVVIFRELPSSNGHSED